MLLFTNYLKENDVENFMDNNGDGFDDRNQPTEHEVTVPHHTYKFGKYSNLDNINWKSFDPEAFLKDSPDLYNMHVNHAVPEADDRINVIKNWAHHHSGGKHYDPSKFGRSWLPGSIESRMENEMEKMQNIKYSALTNPNGFEEDFIHKTTSDGNSINGKSLLIGAAGGALGTAALGFVSRKEKELNRFMEQEKEKEYYKNAYAQMKEEERIRNMVARERERQGVF